MYIVYDFLKQPNISDKYGIYGREWCRDSAST